MKKKRKARRHHRVTKILLACVVFAFSLASLAPVFRKHDEHAKARLDAMHHHHHHPHHRFSLSFTSSSSNYSDASNTIQTTSKTTTHKKEEEEDSDDDDDARRTGAFACPDIREHCEYDGAVVLDGVAAGPTKSIADCCEKCSTTSGCNVYVFCDESWCKGQCWLKRIESPDVETPKLRNGAREGDLNVPWTSGMLMKDYAKAEKTRDGTKKTLKEHVSITTPVGSFTIRLKPEWHRKSVEYLTDLAETENACQGTSCKLYRVEPGFLVQGVLRSFVVRANKETFQFQKLMEYGDVGWAGGSAGPDFFVYLGEKPATWLKFDHTIWGTVQDPKSLEVLEKIVKMDSHTPGGPNTMRFLREEMPIRVA